MVAWRLFSGNTARLDFRLNTYTDATSLAAAIRNLVFEGGGTYMGEALRMARRQIFNATNGDREDVPNVIILVTDGKATDKSAVLNETRHIRNLGIKIVIVDFGSGVS